MNRSQVLQVISEMFYKVGFKTLTMDDIASNLGMSKKTLYEQFESKEKLIAEVLFINFEDVRTYFAQIQEKELNAIEELLVLKRYIDKKFNSIQKQNSMYQLQRYYGKLYNKIYLAQIHKITEKLINNFNKGKTQNLYRKEIDTALCAQLLIEVQNILKANLELQLGSEYNLQLTNAHSDIFIRGILTPKGLKQYENLRQVQ